MIGIWAEHAQTFLVVFGILAAVAFAIPIFLVWPIRVGSLAAAVLVSGGFFAVAHVRSLRFVLYAGAILVALSTLSVGIGLIRST